MKLLSPQITHNALFLSSRTKYGRELENFYDLDVVMTLQSFHQNTT